MSQPRETCPGRRDQKTAVLEHERDRFFDIAVKEPDAENLLRGSHQNEHPTSKLEYRTAINWGRPEPALSGAELRNDSRGTRDGTEPVPPRNQEFQFEGSPLCRPIILGVEAAVPSRKLSWSAREDTRLYTSVEG